MRLIRYAFLAIIAVALVTASLANREIVELKLLPDGLASFAGWNASIDLPLFLVLFLGVVVGVLVGFTLEWLREHKHRAAASHNRREKERLQKEVQEIREPEKGSADEVLAILDNRQTAR